MAENTPSITTEVMPRTKKGQFANGNPGKKKGTLSFAKRKVGDAARELFERFAPAHFEEIFKKKNHPSIMLMKLRQDAIEFLANRAYGKAPVTVKLGGLIDPTSPEGILLGLAKQPLPGGADQSGTDQPSEEE